MTKSVKGAVRDTVEEAVKDTVKTTVKTTVKNTVDERVNKSVIGEHHVIRLEAVTKIYKMGATEVRALRGIDLTVEPGELIAIMGTSGSGKSTLMNLLGCLDTPTAGNYFLDGVRVNGMSRNQLADLRNQKLGFVFQGFNLLARTSALENVELPMLYDRTGKKRDTKALAAAALTRVGLGERIDHHPSELSGGQQQRVAIARALVTEPTLLLADEPTGNLDSRTSVEIMALFQALNDQGITVLLVTHESDIAQYAKRIVEVRDGRIIRDEPVIDRRIAADDLAHLAADDAELVEAA
jgi:putative ABC transport system ATP-binding protein